MLDKSELFIITVRTLQGLLYLSDSYWSVSSYQTEIALS